MDKVKQEQKFSSTEHLTDNTIGPIEAIGLGPMLNPFYHHVSSQRLMMLSAHLVQTLIIKGCEFPGVFSGIEGVLGEYEHDPSARNQDIEIVAVIPRFNIAAGISSFKGNSPYYTVIYRGDADDTIHCFNYNSDTFRSEGYGYPNKQLNWSKLTPGMFLTKGEKLLTSPAHDGNKYMLGTNLNACCMELPHVTEDAFVISESAAEKFTTYGYGKLSFKISSNQIPLDLYGSVDEYKFIPDIGEAVHDDGILCALRTPTINSIIYDTAPQNLTRVQHLHDSKVYAPAGAVIIDVDIVVNRKCKITIPEYIFSQIKKYRDPINTYCTRIIEVYNKMVDEGRNISKEFNNLVTRCMESLAIDGESIPGITRKYAFKAHRRKEAIEFISVTVLYRYERKVKRGFKITQRSGGKGTVAAVWPDSKMPVDAHGVRADIIKAGVSVVNRIKDLCR